MGADANKHPGGTTSLPSQDTFLGSLASGEAGRVHGLAGDLVAPDWPPLTDAEARWVRERWDLAWGEIGRAHV